MKSIIMHNIKQRKFLRYLPVAVILFFTKIRVAFIFEIGLYIYV